MNLPQVWDNFAQGLDVLQLHDRPFLKAKKDLNIDIEKLRQLDMDNDSGAPLLPFEIL